MLLNMRPVIIDYFTWKSINYHRIKKVSFTYIKLLLQWKKINYAFKHTLQFIHSRLTSVD